MDTILILDDSKEDIALLSAALEEQAAPPIHNATTVDEALQCMQRLLHNNNSRMICVCDYYLRCTEAEAVVREIRSRFTSDRVMIVVSSSLIPPVARSRLETQVQAVWDKPVDLDGYDHLAARILQMKGPNAAEAPSG